MTPGRARLAAGGGLGILLWLALALPASAHASLVSTAPAADETVSAPPTEIVITFDETVSASADAIRLFDPAGEQVDGIEPEVAGATMTAVVPDLDTDGSYTVAWKAVSDDGHPVAGAYLFHLDERTLDEPVVPAATSGTPFGAGLLRVAGAAAAFAGLTLVAGPWWFGRRRTAGRRPWAAAAGGYALVVVGGIWASGSWSVFVATASGLAVLAALGVTLVGLVVATTAVAPAVATLALAAGALPGHAVALPPVPLSVTLTVVHVLAAAAWISGLVDLDRTAAGGDDARLADTVRRRSPVLMGAVAALAASGLWMVADRVGWGSLTSVTYGRLAIAKVALLGVAVVLAAYHRFGLAPLLPTAAPLAVGADVSRPGPVARRLRSGVRAEMVVLALAVVLGATLGQFNPAGDELAAEVGPFTERIDFGAGYRAELYVYPAQRGRNDLHLYVFDSGGRPATGVEDIRLGLDYPAEDVTNLEPELVTVTPSHLIAQNVQIPFGGSWIVEATGRTDAFDALDARWDVPFGTQ